MHRILTQRQVQGIQNIEIEMNALRIMAQVLTYFLKEEESLERHPRIMNKPQIFIAGLSFFFLIQRLECSYIETLKAKDKI